MKNEIENKKTQATSGQYAHDQLNLNIVRNLLKYLLVILFSTPGTTKREICLIIAHNTNTNTI